MRAFQLVVDHVPCQQSLGRVGEGAHITGARIDLRVRGEGRAFDLSLEIGVALGLQGERIHRQRRTVFLQRQQLSAVHQDVGIGGAAVAPGHGRVVVERITIGAEQGVAGAFFQNELVGTGAALLEVDATIVKTEHGDHAVAVEPDVIAQEWGKLRIGGNPVERAVDVARHFTVEFEIVDVRFQA